MRLPNIGTWIEGAGERERERKIHHKIRDSIINENYHESPLLIRGCWPLCSGAVANYPSSQPQCRSPKAPQGDRNKFRCGVPRIYS